MDMTTLWAGIAAIGVIGGGIGVGLIGKALLDALARNPQVGSKSMTYAIVAMALAEATSIYALVIAILLIFFK